MSAQHVHLVLSPLIIWTLSTAAELQVPVEEFQLDAMSPENGVLKLSVKGEVDLATAGPMREAAEMAAQSRAYRLLVFDLAGVTFIDSTGMPVLADTNRQMRAAGGAVEVVCSEGLTKLFAVMGLDRLLAISTLPPADDLIAA